MRKLLKRRKERKESVDSAEQCFFCHKKLNDTELQFHPKCYYKKFPEYKQKEVKRYSFFKKRSKSKIKILEKRKNKISGFSKVEKTKKQSTKNLRWDNATEDLAKKAKTKYQERPLQKKTENLED